MLLTLLSAAISVSRVEGIGTAWVIDMNLWYNRDYLKKHSDKELVDVTTCSARLPPITSTTPPGVME